jgi:GNAT superfamily N-acetyltransferase
VDEVSRLVLDSYQPYWRWWREYREEKRWSRVEFPAENVPLETAELEAEMRDRVRTRLQRIADEPDRTVFLARHDGRPVGLCDAVRRPEGDQLEFGVLVLRDFGGKRLGSALLGRALHWLREGGLERARVTTTSGLDDYDPTVYLYNLSYGARILAEFVDLVKHTSARQPSAKTLP